MDANIAVIRGDGIGSEVIDAALLVLNTVAQKYGHNFHYMFVPMGGEAIDTEGVPLPAATLDACKAADAVLLGAVGGPKWDNLAAHLRPERALLTLRSTLGLFASIRPVVLYKDLISNSVLRSDLAKKGMDLVVVRELTGGLTYGPRGFQDGPFGQEAYDTELYSIFEIERIAKVAFELAMQRGKKVTSVDMANVLESGKLWRATVAKTARAYPEVTTEHLLINNCCNQLLNNPAQFDVLLCSNLIGGIVSTQAAQLTGSVGIVPSSSFGAGTFGLYEPIHGSAPDIAGTDTANPIGAILSVGMMLSNTFNLGTEAQVIATAVTTILSKGYRTAEFSGGNVKRVNCSRMAELIAMQI